MLGVYGYFITSPSEQVERLQQTKPPTGKVIAKSQESHVKTIKYSEQLILAYNTAAELGIQPSLVQAILLKESKAGKSASLVGSRTANVGNRSYGVMQIKVEAARSVLTKQPQLVKRYFPTRSYSSLVDEEIIALLLTNHEANIRIGCHHLMIYNKIVDGDWDKAVVAYNIGIGNVLKSSDEHIKNHPYLDSVYTLQHEVVYAFNKKHNLHNGDA
jgi:hypothetical protein